MKFLSVILTFCVFFNLQLCSNGRDLDCRNLESLLNDLVKVEQQAKSHLDALELCLNPLRDESPNITSTKDLSVNEVVISTNVTVLLTKIAEVKKHAQSNLNSLENCRNHIEKTDYEECEKILDDLKARGKLNSNEAIPLAIKIKAAIKDALKESPRQYSRLENLKVQLPQSVQTIIWNKVTQLTAKKFPDQYMYAVVDNLAYDKDRRKVFVWKAGGEHSQGRWQFTTENEGKTFLIRNTHFNEYLYAAYRGYAHDEERRSVFTWRPGVVDKDSEWKVEILGEDEITLKNQYYDQEPLYTANMEYDGQNKHVFTWRPIAGCDDKCIWKLKLV